MRTETLPEASLAQLLFGAYRHRVLSLLMLRPGDSFHLRRIARLTGVPAGSLHRELRQLAAAGLLRQERSGNQVRYSANQSSPVFPELSAMLEKIAGAPPTLDNPQAAYAETSPAASAAPRPLQAVPQRELAEICRRYAVKRMSLYGSAARGELRPDSDIDLLVEFDPGGDTTMLDIVHMQDELSPLFGGREVRIAEPEILKNPHRRRTIEPDLRLLYAA